MFSRGQRGNSPSYPLSCLCLVCEPCSSSSKSAFAFSDSYLHPSCPAFLGSPYFPSSLLLTFSPCACCFLFPFLAWSNPCPSCPHRQRHHQSSPQGSRRGYWSTLLELHTHCWLSHLHQEPHIGQLRAPRSQSLLMSHCSHRSLRNLLELRRNQQSSLDCNQVEENIQPQQSWREKSSRPLQT